MLKLNVYSFQRDRDSVYPMDTSPRGLVLIINNKYFPSFPEGATERRGTNIDAGKLQGMFYYYGFDVRRRDNLRAEVSWCFINVDFYFTAYFKAEQTQGRFNNCLPCYFILRSIFGMVSCSQSLMNFTGSCNCCFRK